MDHACRSSGRRFQELRRRDLESSGKLFDRIQAHISLAAFRRTNVGAVEARQLAQVLLREVCVLPIPLEVRGENGDEGRSSVAASHGRRA